jgi:predicted permease
VNQFRWALLRARALLGRRSLERDMKEELRAHLEQAEARFIARGMSRRDAHNAALREFGNVAAIEEDARDARGTRVLESMMADVRFALRYFARKPLTTVTIVLVLALGIGVNTALFSMWQSITMRPAAGVPKDDAHVRIWALQQKTRGARRELSEFSYPELEALAGRTETFTDVAGWTQEEVIVQSRERSLLRGINSEFVTPNYWRTLRVPIVAGPGYAIADGSRDMAVVLSFALAEEVYGDPAKAVGEQLVVNDVPVRIVGVAPPRFEGAVSDNGRPQLWFPLSARAELTRSSPAWLNEPRFSVFGRLTPSATHAQATAIARDVTTRLLSDSSARAGLTRTAQVSPLRSAPPVQALDEDLIAFAGAGVVTLLILLVACTNVSSLMVASAVGRRHEIAVRLSLGASRSRILRQLLTESALLAFAGAAAGLLVCWWITTIVSRRENLDVVPDAVTVGFTMAFAIGTALIFGLSPALHATRTGVAIAMKDSGTSASGHSRLQRLFVVSQIVFSQPLLVMIAVLLLTVANQKETIPVSVMERVITATFRPLTESGAQTRGLDAVDALALRVANEPAVEAVVPEPRPFGVTSLVVPSRDTGKATAPFQILLEATAPGYFRMMEIPIVLGRDVTLADTNASEMPVLIGTDVARQIWGEESPIGKTLPATTGWEGGTVDSASVTVVGVFDAATANTRVKGRRLFTARGQQWQRDALLVRTRGPARSYLPELQKFIRTSAPALPVTRLATLLDVDRQNRRERLQMIAGSTAAGALALLLASIGLFAVIALAVGQRRREIGIRIALGAEPLKVAAMFFWSGLRMSAIGLLIGLPISVVALRVALSQGLVTGLVFNWKVIGLGIASVVLLVAAAATWFPARKAATVDPALALKAE